MLRSLVVALLEAGASELVVTESPLSERSLAMFGRADSLTANARDMCAVSIGCALFALTFSCALAFGRAFVVSWTVRGVGG